MLNRVRWLFCYTELDGTYLQCWNCLCMAIYGTGAVVVPTKLWRIQHTTFDGRGTEPSCLSSNMSAGCMIWAFV